MSESSDDEQNFAPPAKRHKADQELEVSSDEEVDEAPQQVDWDKVDRAQQARAAVRNEGSTLAAEMGIITELHLTNFMCHRSLHVEFGPRINFIIGRNGSGKSAILTGITICLGGKASVTNRGNNLKDLILKGQQSAEIRLTVKNEGPDAYQPDKYGLKIVIVRIIGLKGGQYKLLSSNGKLVSNTRSELQSILDHMAIQPDNPMLILNQDAAKQFLQSSTETERYNMFMKGTQLKQLSDDYAKVEQAIVILKESSQQQANAMDDLRTDARMAQSKLKDLEAARTLDDRIQKLNKEAVWAEAYEYEAKADSVRSVLSDMDNKLGEAHEKFITTQTEHDQLYIEVKQLYAELGQTEELVKPQTDKLAKLNQQKKELKTENKELDKEISKCVSEKRSLDKQLKKEQKSLIEEWEMASEDHIEVKRQKVQDEIQKHETEYDRVDKEVMRLKEEVRDIGSGAAQDTLKSKKRSFEMQVQGLKSALKPLLIDLKEAEKDGGSNPLLLYGKTVQWVKREVETLVSQGRFKGEMPVGPVGMYARLNKSQYADVCDAHMGLQSPFAFIVSCIEDQRTLAQVFKSHKYGITHDGKLSYTYDIYVARYDPDFDCSSGMPAQSSHYTTLLQVFDFNSKYSELVGQHYINQFQLESIIVVNDRKTGERIMKKWPDNVQACYDQQANKIGHRSGASVNFSMKVNKTGKKGYAHLCPRNQDDMIKVLESQIKVTRQEIVQVEQQLRETDDQIVNITKLKDQLEEQAQDLQGNLPDLRVLIDEGKSALEELNLERINDKTAAREREIESLQQQISHYTAQFEHLEECKLLNKSKIKEIDVQMHLIQDELEAVQSDFQEKQQSLENKAANLHKFKSDLVHFEAKRNQYQDKKDAAQKNYDQMFEEFERVRQLAMEYCNDVVIEKKDLPVVNVKKLQVMIANLEKELECKEKEHGFLEDAMLNYNEKSQKLESAEVELATAKNLVKILLAAVNTRKIRYSQLRSKIAIDASVAFSALLDERGYSGGLKFDHGKKQLKVAVQVEKAMDVEVSRTQNTKEMIKARNRRQDPKSLSGGEKSFSTVCLLLALWEAMGSSIRALDEFDVFMDQINRTYSMKLIVESAQNALRCQYIMLTPQAMQGNKFPPDVKCIKIKDPERTQIE